MDSSQFFNATQKYITTLFKEGKRISPDFELLNELYVNVADNSSPYPPDTSSSLTNKILIDVSYV